MRRFFSRFGKNRRSLRLPLTHAVALPRVVSEPSLDSLLKNADALRDAGNTTDAALAYQKASLQAPERSDILVQMGNMLKDSYQFVAAEIAYRQALALSDQADTHLQLGHLLKSIGNRSEALAEYRKAASLDPNAHGPIQELAEAADQFQQQRRFVTQFREGGIEVLITLTHAISSMRSDLDRLSRLLPEAQAQTAFPTTCYDIFRDIFPVPLAPKSSNATFHLILLAERADVATLFAQIDAIQSQSWSNWTLSVLGHSPERRRVVDLVAIADVRVRWVEVVAALSLASAEQDHITDTPHDWVVLFAEGAILDPQALAWFAAAATWSGAGAFISDEEVGIRERGHVIRTSPILRQVVDFDTLLESNVFGETLAIKGDIYGKILPALPRSSITASRTTLLLALARNGQVGHVPYPLLWRSTVDSTVPIDHQTGVAAYLKWAGLTDQIEFLPGTRQPLWHSHQPQQRIAVIIPTRNNANDLTKLVGSLQKTAVSPADIEIIIIDNGSTELNDLSLLQNLALEDGVQVLRRDEPFNWSNLNNKAVTFTDAPFILFLNDDMRMTTIGWDIKLRGLLEREDVGAVGARLLYQDGTVQHAGVLFGWKGSVIHDGLFEEANEAGPANRWQVTRAVGAVTGAFLATRRDRFIALGGFDASALPVAYSDIDFALRLRNAGLKVLWTPAITLYHYESKTRGLDHTDEWRSTRNVHEQSIMQTRWGAMLDYEPGVHPFWHAATLPFRLLSFPSAEKVREHIIQTASPIPWQGNRKTTGNDNNLQRQ